MDEQFESSWKEYFTSIGDKKNSKISIIVLLACTIMILPDAIFTESFSSQILFLRIFLSFIGFILYFLFIFKIINNKIMVLGFAVPMLILLSYSIALKTDPKSISKMNSIIVAVGIFYMATFILNVSSWIILCLSFCISYIAFITLLSDVPFNQYLLDGGSFVLICFIAFPFISKVNYRLYRETFKLNFEINIQKEKLEICANNDLLTNSFNRRGGMKILEQAISMAKRHKLPLSICFVDIDGLKKVNDKFGHGAGDILIQTISKLIINNIRESDVLFRLGGDEFIIVFPGCKIDDSLPIMKFIHDITKDYKSENTKDFNVSFSYGLCEYENKMTIEDFISSADKKMYFYKK